MLAMLAAGCGSSTSPVQTAISRPGPESIFEPKGPLFADPPGTLDLMRRLGVDRVKVFVAWNSLAPDASSRVAPRFDAANPSAYPAGAWSQYDAIVRAAAARGIAVYLAVGGPAPLWATQPHAPRGAPYGGAQWKPSPAAYGRFVRAVARRYDGTYTPPGASSPLPRVSFWGIWNEPNLGSQDLAPQAIDHSAIETSPAMYRGLVDVAWSAFQATGHGGDTILIGELAPYGQTGPGSPGDFGEMVPLRFLRALYCVDSGLHPLRGAAASARLCPTTTAGSNSFARDHPGLFQASGFAMHPYPSGQLPPNAPPPGSPDFVDMATLPRLEHVLDAVTSAYGSNKRFPIYITEYGYITDPPYSLGAPLQLAAAYLNHAEYMAWLDPRIRSTDQFLLMDPPPGSRSNFDTGLESSSGAHKPSFDAYRMPIFLPLTRGTRGQSLEVWGCVRPAHYVAAATGAAQRVKIELRSAPGQPFTTIAVAPITNVHGYFDVRVRFPSSGSVRLAWSYPHGPTVYSRSVAITVS